MTEQKLTNLEILCFVRGWQGGTVHQMAAELQMLPSEIIDATYDDMQLFMRKAQRLRANEEKAKLAALENMKIDYEKILEFYASGITIHADESMNLVTIASPIQGGTAFTLEQLFQAKVALPVFGFEKPAMEVLSKHRQVVVGNIYHGL